MLAWYGEELTELRHAMSFRAQVSDVVGELSDVIGCLAFIAMQNNFGYPVEYSFAGKPYKPTAAGLLFRAQDALERAALRLRTDDHEPLEWVNRMSSDTWYALCNLTDRHYLPSAYVLLGYACDMLVRVTRDCRTMRFRYRTAAGAHRIMTITGEADDEIVVAERSLQIIAMDIVRFLPSM